MSKSLNVIYFAINGKCNLSCKYCYLPDEIKQQKYDYLQVFKEFVDKLVREQYCVGRFVFHGVEPTTLHGSVYRQMIDYYKSNISEPVLFSMQTNGVNMNDLFDYVTPQEMALSFGLDGYFSNHEELRGKGTFHKSLNNIMLSKRLGFSTSVISVLHAGFDLDQLSVVADLLEDNGVRFILKGIHTEEENFSIFNQNGYDLGVKIYENGLYKHTQFCNKRICTFAGNDCIFFQFNSDKTVWVCNKSYGINSDSIANWEKDSFDSIVNVRIMRHLQLEVNNECKECKYWNFCHAGCPTDRIENKSLECMLKKGVFDSALENGQTVQDLFDTATNYLQHKKFLY